MDKQQLEKLFNDFVYGNTKEAPKYGFSNIDMKNFIFDTIIPNILNSLMIKERAKAQDEDLQAHMDSTYYIFNKYIRDRSKELYGVNLQPFTFIPSQTKPCKKKTKLSTTNAQSATSKHSTTKR